jgi:HSP20 family protein
LKGEKKFEREEKKEDYHLTERSYGSFQRAFRLGGTIDPDKVTAAFDKGVLKVTLAKRPEAVKAENRFPIGNARYANASTRLATLTGEFNRAVWAS